MPSIRETGIIEIEGIGPAYTAKLRLAGITTVEGLLEMGRSRKGRSEIAKKSGLSEHQILEWVNRADLARVQGVGSEYADLLEAAGVDSCAELAQRNAANLSAKLAEVNAAKNLVRALPAPVVVEGWIEEAKRIKIAVEH